MKKQRDTTGIFKTGQSADSVLRVMRRTGRKRTKMRVITPGGPIDFDLTRKGKAKIDAEVEAAGVELKDCPPVIWWLDSGEVLTFKHTGKYYAIECAWQGG